MSTTGIDSATPFVAGQTKTLEPTATFSDGPTQDLKPGDVRWSSSDPSIATVDPAGDVKGVTPGDATISFTYQDVTGVADVSVVARKLTGIELTADNTSVPAGASIQITVHGTFNDNTSETLGAADGITLDSADPAIAAFSPSTFGDLETLNPGVIPPFLAEAKSGAKRRVPISASA